MENQLKKDLKQYYLKQYYYDKGNDINNDEKIMQYIYHLKN